MNDTAKRDRSPNYPKLPLLEAIEYTKRLYEKAGKAKLSAEAAVVALGYSGLNGAALTTVGALSQYGLIDRERGESIGVSASAIKLLHPLDKAQELTTKRELALRPKVFNELYAGGFYSTDQQVLANHLRQSGFTSDGAEKASTVYLENFEFAKLGEVAIIPANEQKPKTDEQDRSKQTVTQDQSGVFSPGRKVLAKYSIPLGGSVATLEITGEALSADDFDALAEYVELFKKQFERKQASAGTEQKKSTEAGSN